MDTNRPALTRSRLNALPFALGGALVALTGWVGWQALRPDHGDPIATSLVALEKQNRLTVFSAQVSPVVAADDERLFGMLKSRQIAVIPARIDYTLDVSKLGKDRMRWDEASGRLTVTVPAIEVSRPNLDEARAQYLREGVWIGREAQAKLTRDNTLLAERQASEQARNPVLIDMAKGAARDAMRQNLEIPLQAAGYDDIRVVVLFDGEAAPPALPAAR